MSWSSKTAATQKTSVTAITYFDQVVTLNPGETAHCQVDVNFPASPTDDAIVEVFTTLDASSENWDDTPFLSQRVSRLTDPNAVSFLVADVYKFRVGIRRSGTTDTITSADFAYRKNGINL